MGFLPFLKDIYKIYMKRILYRICFILPCHSAGSYCCCIMSFAFNSWCPFQLISQPAIIKTDQRKRNPASALRREYLPSNTNSYAFSFGFDDQMNVWWEVTYSTVHRVLVQFHLWIW